MENRLKINNKKDKQLIADMADRGGREMKNIIMVLIVWLVAAASVVMAAEEPNLSFKREATGDVTVFKLTPLEVLPKVPLELPGPEAYALKHGLKGELKIDGKPIEELVLAFFMKSEVTPSWTIYKYANGAWPAYPQIGEKVVSTNWLFAILFQWLISIFVFVVSICFGLKFKRMALLCAVIAGSVLICSLASFFGQLMITILIGIYAAGAIALMIDKTKIFLLSVLIIIGGVYGRLIYELAEEGMVWWQPALYLAGFCFLAARLAEAWKRWKKYREE